jgi:hypothetical protein
VNPNEAISSEASVAAPEGDAKTRSMPWWWWVSLAPLFALCVLVMAPLDTSKEIPAWDELDASFADVMRWAYAHHVDLGKELFNAHGVWGLADIGFEPGMPRGVAGAWLLLAGAYFAGLARIARQLGRKPWAGLVWLAAVILLGGVAVNIADARKLVLPWLLLLIHFYVDDREWTFTKILLGAAIGFVSLMKMSFMVSSLGAVGVITIEQLWRRRVPSMLVVYVISVLGFWIAAGQPIASFGEYLKTAAMFSGGYLEGEAQFSPTEATDIGQFILATACFLAGMALAHPWGKGRAKSTRDVLDEVTGRRRVVTAKALSGRQSWLAILGTLALLMVVFKSGYVRHDVHEMGATATLALMSVTLAAALWPRFQSGVAQGYVVVAALGVVYLSWASQLKYAGTSGPENLLAELGELPRRAHAAVDVIGGKGAEAKWERPGWADLPRVSGTVDIYSYDQRTLLSEGLDYHPRPIFQSYQTFTEAMANMNAAFVSGSNGAGTVLFDLQPIDFHLPSQEDGTTWPVLMSQYELADASGTHLVLRRRDEAGTYSMKLIGQKTGRLGRWISVPDSDEPMWAKVRLNLTPLGELMRLIYKVPILHISMDTTGSGRREFRFLRQEAEGGFLMSPLVENRMDFGLLYSKDWNKLLGDRRVTGMEIFAPTEEMGQSSCYEDEYSVEFYAVNYPHGDIWATPGVADYLKLSQTVRDVHVFAGQENNPPRVAESDEEKMVLYAPAEARLMIAVPPDAKEFHFGYGMYDRSWRAKFPTDGVDFRLYGVDTEIGKQISAGFIGSMHLDPGKVPADRGLHHGVIDLPKGKVYGIILETVPGDKNWLSDSYWADFYFK